jgi:hypothetical protein
VPTIDLIPPEVVAAPMVDATFGAVVCVGIGEVGDPSIVITKVLEGVFNPESVDDAMLYPLLIAVGAAEFEPIVEVSVAPVEVMSLALLVPYWEVRDSQLESSRPTPRVYIEELMAPFVYWQ